MSTISAYLDILRQTGADEVRLAAREPVMVTIAGRKPVVGGSPVSARILAAILDEVLGNAPRHDLKTRPHTVMHTEGSETVLVEVSEIDAQVTVVLRPSRGGASRAGVPAAVPVARRDRSEPIRIEPGRSESARIELNPRSESARIEVGARGETRADLPRSEPVRIDLPSRADPTRSDLPRSEPVRIDVGHTADRNPIDGLLREMIAAGASDLHLSAGEHPVVRVHGEIVQLTGRPKLTSAAVQALVAPLLSERTADEFASTRDADCAYEVPGLARFRVNVFEDRKGTGAVLRQIPITIISAADLGLPKACLDLCALSKGLVVVTGPTGSGKSTTLAAMVDHINRTRSDHIITIEDPIEFVHPNLKCLVNQREVGTHTKGFKQALRAALREDPDVVLVGEMRDLETVAIAIETAETGHLVFGTLHTTTATSTVDRIIDQFPVDRQQQIRVMLSESLKGVVAQVLCKKKGGGRVAAHEVLLATPAVAALIRDGKTFQLANVMQTSRAMGMVTMNDALFSLVQRDLVEPREAWLKSVDKPGLLAMLKSAGLPSAFDP